MCECTPGVDVVRETAARDQGAAEVAPDVASAMDAMDVATGNDARALDTAPPCDPPRSNCNGICTDLSTDFRNCGA
jgi:hypothetical protein